MATSVQPRRKAKKYQNGLRSELFTRLQFTIGFEDDPTDMSNISGTLLESYSPRVLGSCTLAWRLPKSPLNVYEYYQCIILPGQTPYYNPPPLPSPLPNERRHSRITKPTHYSIIPLLMTAYHARINIQNYNVVSERNSFRLLAMNDEDFVITVTRFGSTLFLRRYASYHSIDKNDPGYRFEQMSTTTSNNLDGDYFQLIEGRIGELNILMLCETDAIRRDNNEAIELKCNRAGMSKSKSMEHDWWLQAFLSGTNTIINGRYGRNNQPEIFYLKEYRVSELNNEQLKMKTFHRLHRVLQFLLSNVAEKRIYMIRGQKNETRKHRNIFLYEVVNERDRQTLTFINQNLLDRFTINN